MDFQIIDFNLNKISLADGWGHCGLRPFVTPDLDLRHPGPDPGSLEAGDAETSSA